MTMQMCLRHLQRLEIAVAVVSLAGVAEGKVATFAGKYDSYIAIDHDKLCVDDATLEVWVHPTSVQGWRVSDSPQRQTNCAGNSECYHAVLTFAHSLIRIRIYIYMHMHMHIIMHMHMHMHMHINMDRQSETIMVGKKVTSTGSSRTPSSS